MPKKHVLGTHRVRLVVKPSRDRGVAQETAHPFHFSEPWKLSITAKRVTLKCIKYLMETQSFF